MEKFSPAVSTAAGKSSAGFSPLSSRDRVNHGWISPRVKSWSTALANRLRKPPRSRNRVTPAHGFSFRCRCLWWRQSSAVLSELQYDSVGIEEVDEGFFSGVVLHHARRHANRVAENFHAGRSQFRDGCGHVVDAESDVPKS